MGRDGTNRKDIDTGWAWVVMTSTYVGMVIYCVPLYMSGVLYMALLDKFHEGEAKTSLIGALSSALLCFTAPVGGAINNKYSCRVSIILGAALTTLGFVLSAFVPNLNWMIVTAGVLVGIGYGISSSGLICVVGFYFERWRDTVISGAFISVGLGMLVSAPFGIYLISTYGLSATFLIVACIQAQVCVCGMLSKPSCIEKEVKDQKERARKRKLESKSKTYLDVTVMKNVSYTCFLCSISSWNFALCVAVMHLPNYMSILGGSNSEIGLLMTSFSVANLTGRLLGSLTISNLHERSVYVYAFSIGVSGVVTSLFILYADLPGGSYIFAVQLGLFTGWPNSMMTPLSLSFVGVHKLSEAYGLAYVFCGIGGMTGPVLIGGVLCLGCIVAVCSICLKNRTYPDDKKMEVIVQETNSSGDLTIGLMKYNTGNRLSSEQKWKNNDRVLESNGDFSEACVSYRGNKNSDIDIQRKTDNGYEVTETLLNNAEQIKIV